VCNFGDKPPGDGGFYADASSLRSILRRNGLEALATGFIAKKPTPPPPPIVSTPQATPEPEPQLTPAPPSPIATAESSAISFLGPILAGTGIGGAGVLASLVTIIRSKGRSATGAQPSPPPPTLEQALAVLAGALKQRAEQKARDEANAELLAKFESMVLAGDKPEAKDAPKQ
jgi:hypothetical protein